MKVQPCTTIKYQSVTYKRKSKNARSASDLEPSLSFSSRHSEKAWPILIRVRAFTRSEALFLFFASSVKGFRCFFPGSAIIHTFATIASRVSLACLCAGDACRKLILLLAMSETLWDWRTRVGYTELASGIFFLQAVGAGERVFIRPVMSHLTIYRLTKMIN